MKTGPDIARIAALIGDPARANILTALMSGKALTATELAAEAGVTAQTASAHLARLETGGLVTQSRQGRHKYTRLASEDVAHLPSPRTPLCRDCLDWSERRAHLAGRLGRGLLAHIESQGWAQRVSGTRIVRFSPAGTAAFDSLFPAP
jgi:DNA-binding transcriptional ArsR family regulator